MRFAGQITFPRVLTLFFLRVWSTGNVDGKVTKKAAKRVLIWACHALLYSATALLRNTTAWSRRREPGYIVIRLRPPDLPTLLQFSQATLLQARVVDVQSTACLPLRQKEDTDGDIINHEITFRA